MIPPFVSFPNAKVRRNILPEEWALYLDSWTSLSELYLRLNDQEFTSSFSQSNLETFLSSFFHELAEDQNLATTVIPLRRKCFLLLHRLWSGDHKVPSLLHWLILSNICQLYVKSEQLRFLLQNLWKREGETIEKSLQTAKSSLIKSLDSKNPENAEDSLNRLGPFLRVSTDAASFMLTGSDLLDSLGTAWGKTSGRFQKKLVTTAYLGLTALLDGPKPNFSTLSDHLYSLKSTAEQEQKSSSNAATFLADVVTNTPLLQNIRVKATAPDAARVVNMAASLSVFQQSRPKRLIRRKVDKGKSKVKMDEYGHGAFQDISVHQMGSISQIQDLFPHLGSGFVVKLLNEYNDGIEQVTAHLLEDSLPPHLANANRNEQLYVLTEHKFAAAYMHPDSPEQTLTLCRPTATAAAPTHLTPRSTPPPIAERRNVFDNDEFDRLAVDASRLHIGRRNQALTADSILSDRSKAPNRSAILAALAAFDSDDDERDDTYDIEDVGGTVDNAIPGADEADADLRDKNEESLFRAYSMSPELFGRDSETRRGKPRAALKSETGMTDEAIEGWGIMIGRDPKRLRRLEAKFSQFMGQQRELASSSWKDSPEASGEEASGEGNPGGRGGFPGRGRGRGRGRGGGNVAGPSDDKATQQSRQRKEAGKGSRANHNRRDQRARKMARGGLPG
jgi:activating signal cointegrator complex subunit 2